MTNHRDPTRTPAVAAPTSAEAPNPDAASIDCLAAARQLWDCLDGELTEQRMQVVRAHLEACARCAPHFDFERRFLDALAATRTEQPPAPAGLRQRVVRALRGAGFVPG
jgi:anti-sigma factor (TIGR02949 family)